MRRNGRTAVGAGISRAGGCSRHRPSPTIADAPSGRHVGRRAALGQPTEMRGPIRSVRDGRPGGLSAGRAACGPEADAGASASGRCQGAERAWHRLPLKNPPARGCDGRTADARSTAAAFPLGSPARRRPGQPCPRRHLLAPVAAHAGRGVGDTGTSEMVVSRCDRPRATALAKPFRPRAERRPGDDGPVSCMALILSRACLPGPLTPQQGHAQRDRKGASGRLRPRTDNPDSTVGLGGRRSPWEVGRVW